MAKLVTTNQRIRTGVTYPKSGYSRVVGFSFSVAAGLGTEWFGYTGSLAQELWLLNVKFRFASMTAGTLAKVDWRIVSCTMVPTSGEQIAAELEAVMDMRTGAVPYMSDLGQDVLYSFDMSRHYSGSSWRFALWVRNNTDVPVRAMASFQISEG